MKILLVKDGRVVNVVDSESIEEASRIYPDHLCLEELEGVKPGHEYIEGEFVAPLVVQKVPLTVTPRQIRQAMNRIGLRSTIESAIAAGDQDLKDWWEFSTVFERNRPQVLMMAEALGKTSKDLDDLWMLASTL